MIARTELAHIQTQAAKKRYEDYGVQEVEIWAEKDERQCEICGKLHQKKYPIGAAVPIPAHPRCRCCIIPMIEYRAVDGTIDIKVDEFVPCLKDAKTGEILPTIVEPIDKSQLKGYNNKNGWYVNWSQLEKEGCKIQAVKVKGSDIVEGLVATSFDEQMKATYINYIVAAPHNQKPHKKYVGVGGHLFAVAAEEALKTANGDMVGFAANEKLVKYYTEELFAEYIGIIHPGQVIWDSVSCKKLLEMYNYERQ